MSPSATPRVTAPSDARPAAPLRLVALLLPLAAACRGESSPDAYGTFEATEVVVSARTGGTLTAFRPREGERVTPGTVLGLVDTTMLALERAQLLAQRAATRARALEAGRQLGVLDAQRGVAERAYAARSDSPPSGRPPPSSWTRRSATSACCAPSARRPRRRANTVAQEVAAADARLAQVEERLRESRIESPIAGTVLAPTSGRASWCPRPDRSSAWPRSTRSSCAPTSRSRSSRRSAWGRR
jgi:HlyD family secretion protein